MKLYLLKKEKGKKYESKSICKAVLGFDLQYDGEKPVNCSISDTKNYWACAIGECGIDIEEANRMVKPTAAKALHNNEQEYLKALSFGTSEWTKEFLRIWTIKEAYYKLFGISFKQHSVLDGDMLYIDSEADFLIQSFETHNLVGCVISKEEFEIVDIKYAGISAKPAVDYAADLLAIKAYAKSDLQKKLLTKGYTQNEIDLAINKLEELGYLDDAEYAKRFADHAALNGKGNYYIKSKLQKSGISPDLIPELDDEFERAYALAKNMPNKTPDQIGRRLAGLGFSPSAIYKVLSKIR